MQYRNYRSDFNINETFFRIQEGAKVSVNVPERLQIDYFTEEGRYVFSASRDGSSYTNCSLSPDGKTLTVHLSLRDNPVGCGRLQKLVTEIHPDLDFPDGERHTLIPGEVDVILYKGKASDLEIPESEVVIVDGIFTIDTSDFLTEIPVATPSRLGGVKIGDGLCVAPDGLLAVDFEKAVTKDYLQGVIDSLPDIPDVSGFATIAELDAVSARVSVLEQRINWDDIFGIDSDGNVYVKKRRVSGTEVPRGFFTYGFLSGGGLSDTEPGGGADLATVWGSLRNTLPDHTYDNYQIDPAHLVGYATQTWVGQQISALNLGAAATYGIGSVASGNGGLVTGGAVWSSINTAVASAIRFQGVTTTALTDGSTTRTITIDGSSYTAQKGDVVVYGGLEFLWTGSAWQQLGDESSYALKTVTVSGTGYLAGGGDLTANRTIDIASTYKGYIDDGHTAYGYFSSGVLPYNHGGTGLSSFTKGDLIYASKANTLARLSANTGTKKFLSMTSSVPSWSAIAYSDLPALYIARTQVKSAAANDTMLGITAISNASSSGSSDKSRIVWDATNEAWHFLGNVYADGFMSSGGLSDTSSGGGADLVTVWGSLQNAISDHTYDSRKIATAHLPTLGAGLAYSSSGSGASLATTLSIASDYKLPTTTEWGNKADASALAGYVPISTPVTVSAAHTFSAGFLLNTASSSWSNTDRAIPFSASGNPDNIRYYYDDADKGLTFNPYSGALKAASFVKRGGTSSQFLKADGSVDSNTYALSSSLGNYLPLAGGTLTGALVMPTGSSALSANGIDFGTTAHLGASSSFGIYSTGSIYLRPGNGTQSGSYGIVVGYDSLTYNSNDIYHAGNSNLTSVSWNAKNLTLAGSITGATTIAASTSVTTPKLYLASGIYFEVVNGNVHLVVDSANGKGFYTDGFVSASGVSGSGTGGGIDALAMWKLLTNNNALTTYDNNTKIASAHIPIATASAVGGIKVGSNLSISNGVLSATNTTYSAGTGLTLSGTTFFVTANTYAPYNANGYLPLSGGTMTSTALISWGENFKTDWNASFDKGLQIFSSQVSGSNAPTQYATALSVIGQYGFQLALKGGNFSNFYIRSIASGQRTWYELLHTGNYNSFVPTLTGTGASGTWGISVTGSAASLSSGITLWGKSGINAGTSYGGDLTINNAAYLNFKDAAGTGNAGRIYATSSDYFRIEGASGISLRTGSSIATRMYINSSGNVGIGTTSPAYNFDVVGTGYFSTGAVIANGTGAGFKATNSAGTADTTLMYLSSSDNLMVGTGTAIAGGSTLINGANITFRYYASGAFSEIARFTSDGYLGIGTTTPAYPLDVAGKIYASQGVNIANGYAFRSIDNPSSGEPTERALLHLSSGNICWVGYGMASPGYDTKVAGTNLELCYGSSRTTGATLTSTGDFQVANTLTITNTSAAAHIGFSRTGLNYITAPATGSINFVLGTTLSSSASVLRLLDGSAILNGTLSASDAITLSGTTAASRRIYFGDSSHYLELNSNGFHFSHGVYSDSFMSGGGLSDSGSYLGSVAEDIIPDATRTRSLGSSSKMWTRTYTQYIDTQSSYALRICTGGTERIRIASSNPNVSIGNIATETGYSIVCAAKIKCTALEQTSDARLKNILGNVELSVSDIANAPAVYFTWKQDGTLGAGSIAQYWKERLPWCVSDSGKALSMDYGQIALLSAINLAKAVETQGEKITRLEKTVKAQQKEINRLRAKASW